MKRKAFIIGGAFLALTFLTGAEVWLTPQEAEAKVDINDVFDFQPHRGGRDARPENTLYAYAYALEMGTTSIECDMQLTADGEIVMSHNPLLNPDITRDGQGEYVTAGAYDIRKMTVAEIQKFNVARINPATEYYELHGISQVTPEFAKIPTLEEFLQLIKASGDEAVLLNIEVKSYPDPLTGDAYKYNADKGRFLQRFNELIAEYQMEDRTVLQTFDWEILRMEKELNPRITLSALWQEQPSWGKQAESLRRWDKEKSPWLGGLDIKDFKGDPVQAAKAIGADIISPYYMEISKEMVEEAHNLGMKVVPWTVNSCNDMEMMYDMGVDGLISDKPWLLRSFLEERGAKLRPKRKFDSAYHMDIDHRDAEPSQVQGGADAAY